MTSFAQILVSTGPTMTVGSRHSNVDGQKGSRRLPNQSLPVSIPVKTTVTKLSVVLPALPHPLAGPSALCSDTRTAQQRWLRSPGSHLGKAASPQVFCSHPGIRWERSFYPWNSKTQRGPGPGATIHPVEGKASVQPGVTHAASPAGCWMCTLWSRLLWKQNTCEQLAHCSAAPTLHSPEELLAVPLPLQS